MVNKSSQENINTILSLTLSSPGLSIDSRLMGHEHIFTFSECTIKVRLPSEELFDALSRHPDLDNQISQLSYVGETTSEANKVYFLSVFGVEVTVKNETLKVPRKFLATKPITYSLLEDEAKEVIGQKMSVFTDVAKESYAYWLRVVRWKTQNSSIGRLVTKQQEAISAPVLKEETTEKRLWLSPITFTVYVGSHIDSHTWHNIQLALSSSEVPPLYYEYYFDGVEHRKLEDLKRATVDFAICSEIYLRTKVLAALPKLPSSITSYVEKANVAQFVNQFFPELLSDKGLKVYKPIQKKMQKLFDIRNTVLHSGKSLFTDIDVQAHQNATKELLNFDEFPHNWKKTS